MHSVVLHVSGYPTTRVAGQIVTFATRYDLALLLYLALNQVQHSREKLCRLLWPDATGEDSRSNLRSSLSRLRHEFGPWLHADRATVALVIDTGFQIDRTGLAPVADGFHINSVYDSWLETLTAPPTVSESWVAKHRSITTPVAAYCNGIFPDLVTRNHGASFIEMHYGQLAGALLAATSPDDFYVIGNTLVAYTVNTGKNVQATAELMAQVPESSELLFVSKPAARAFLAYQYNFLEKTMPSNAYLTDSKPLIFYSNITLLAENAQAGNYPVAAEHAQIALANGLSTQSPYANLLAIIAAALCSLSGQKISAEGYIRLARQMATEAGSDHYMPRIETVERALRHA